MVATALRIVSLLPSATEMICQLGYGDALVGRSHACDFPASVQALPVCTAPKFDPVGSSRQIHERVTTLLQSALSVYQVDLDRLRQLRPTHIVTQAQCDVCAVSLSEVEAAIATGFDRGVHGGLNSGPPPTLISLQPNLLADLWADFQRLALTLDPQTDRGTDLVAALQARLQGCVDRVPDSLPRPTVACLEWTDPLMAAGNWVPELVALAGGHSLFGRVGQHSPWLAWEDLLAADPDIIVAMPCGYDLAQARTAVASLTHDPRWQQLRAVQQHRLYLVDGNQYFNRPGPRLVDSLEILAEIFYPDHCASGYALKAWKLF